MDAAEALGLQLATSAQPQEDFESGRELVKEFLGFMAVEELQHEKEEEQVLLPVLAQQLNEAKPNLPKMSMERMCREHAVGQRLVKELGHKLALFEEGRGNYRQEQYYLLSEALHDVVWHYRRHMALENSIILPTAERLIPDNRDELWAKSSSKPECPDA